MVIKTPYVTEKASMMLDTDGKLQFIVRREANKNQIARAVGELFGHKVYVCYNNDDNERPEESCCHV